MPYQRLTLGKRGIEGTQVVEALLQCLAALGFQFVLNWNLKLSESKSENLVMNFFKLAVTQSNQSA